MPNGPKSQPRASAWSPETAERLGERRAQPRREPAGTGEPRGERPRRDPARARSARPAAGSARACRRWRAAASYGRDELTTVLRYAERPSRIATPSTDIAIAVPIPHQMTVRRRLAREPRRDPEQPEDDERQHPRQGVQQLHALLRVAELRGVEQLELQRELVDRDRVEDRDATVLEQLAHLLDDRGEVERHPAVPGRDDLAAAGERRLDLVVGDPVRVLPRGPRRRRTRGSGPRPAR